VPSCYSFNKVCLPANFPMGPCAIYEPQYNCNTQMWFWWAAAAVGAGLAIAYGSGK